MHEEKFGRTQTFPLFCDKGKEVAVRLKSRCLIGLETVLVKKRSPRKELKATVPPVAFFIS
ncbi:hypothetical protein ACFQZX_06290 [Mucilaginibacter litoreus]|uniref:Uncharacterized protein n=1 Tax=Mucilaginibacter litoreus TaxID=1048221 RepID=A0ABW3ASI5_9SPHI